MEIDGLSEPVAGKEFNFRVTGDARPLRIEILIGRVRVMESECPDPPCHEMVLIPRQAGGAEILIIARDRLGNVEQRKFRVRYADSSGGAMATAD